MSDKPILFSGTMVRGLVREIEQPGTGKTQTRRGLFNKEPPSDGRRARFRPALGTWEWRTKYDNFGGTLFPQPRYRVGDRLYVREAWKTSALYDTTAPSALRRDVPIYYLTNDRLIPVARYRQAIHMPRWASRITLTVTDARVERLQDISDADAFAEGIPTDAPIAGIEIDIDGDWWAGAARARYRQLWDQINGPGSWEANPWVAAYTFTVALGNIDQIGRAA